MNKIDFYETKKIYWNLIIFFMKKEQNEHTKKCIEELENGWYNFEEKNKETLF